MKNVFIINTHQRYEGVAEGKLNHTLTNTAENFLKVNGYKVKTTVVENGYDIPEELSKYKWADAVIVQTPVYWMSVPALFKKYIDEVFTSGMGGDLCMHDGRDIDDPSKKYGTGGTLKGIKYMISTTWNAPLESFEESNQFFKGKTVDDVFFWLHKNFHFFGMEPLPTFACFDVMKNPNIKADMNRFKAHLTSAFVKE